MMKIIQKSLFLLGFLVIVHSQAQSNIDSFDKNGKTALIKAISNNDLSEVKSLLNKGANINVTEQKGLKGTPLMYAVSTGDLMLCKLLIDNGAKINQLDVNKDHALNWATYYGYVSIMNLLIKNGTDLNIKSKHGTAVDVAFRLWHHDSVAKPFKKSLFARSLTKNQTRLINAVANDNVIEIKKLLKKGESPNTIDELGTPILQLAAQKGNLEIVKILVNNNADLNILNRVGQTPLAWASRFGHLSTVNYLINSGADVNKSGKEYKLTPLMGAAINGKESVIALLLESKAKVDIKDVVNNATALHWALWYNQSNVAKLLLQHGADFMYKALNGTYSAYDTAKFSKMNDVLLIMEALKEKSNILKGSWKILEIHYEYPDTTYIAKEKDYGRFIFSDNNYSLMYNPRMKSRKPFKNLSKPSEPEIINAFGSIVFNTGSYKTEKNIITTTADIAKVPGFEGGKQFYKMTTNDNKLELVMYDETYPSGDKPEWFGKLKVKFILKKELP